MEIFIWVIWFLVAALFGWFCSEVCLELERNGSRKSWMGCLVLFLGIAYMWLAGWAQQYSWKHKDYDSAKYEIVHDTTITNHNGQIDTLATFKIVEK